MARLERLARAQAEVPIPSREPGLELTVDSVGFERRQPPPPGAGATWQRDPRSYFNLDHGLLDHPELLDAVFTHGVVLGDVSLLATPKELCHPAFAQLVARHAPPRLLLSIRGRMDAAALDCLGSLQTPRLYLQLCPHENIVYGNCDGDRELADLAAHPTLPARVFGLSLTFSEATTWEYLRVFVSLEDLHVRGKALRELRGVAGQVVCDAPNLKSLDLYDASELGGDLRLSWPCVARLRNFEAATLPDDASFFGATPCRLRRVFLWTLMDKPQRDALATCDGLEGLLLVSPPRDLAPDVTSRSSSE